MFRFKSYINEKIDIPVKSMGIDRNEMPQIDSKDVSDFISHLKALGVVSKSEKLDPKKLTATQHQFHKEKIQNLIDKIEDGDYDNGDIIVSKDKYVMDGHHRWLAHYNLDIPIAAKQIDVPAEQLIELMKDYPKSYTKKLYETYK
jgi:ABC-type Zn uptake system ZnuABC Zn-binding protein ZnuA